MKTKDHCGKLPSKTVISMKKKDLTAKSGNPVEKKGS
jgi:hypothetical protein